jgi:hypothetical protein
MKLVIDRAIITLMMLIIFFTGAVNQTRENMLERATINKLLDLSLYQLAEYRVGV